MKNVYITWHYTTHGIAYMKHVLSQFYQLDKLVDNVNYTKLNQELLNDAFNSRRPNGFVFDKVVYLTAPQESFDRLSTRRNEYKTTVFRDELIEQEGVMPVWRDILDKGIVYEQDALFDFVSKNHPEKLVDFKRLLWRSIQHFSIPEQIKWLEQESNFKNVYQGKLEVVELKVKDLRDERKIAQELSKWVAKEILSKKDVRLIINLSLGSNETQVVWHILAEARQLPKSTRFVKTPDDKLGKKEGRFKPFSILETPTNLISLLTSDFSLFLNTKSPLRALVNKKMETFINTGFSILLIGERGIGKSQIVKGVKKYDKRSKIVEANCASFAEDSKAEAELFGYKKDAFTGAREDKNGLLKEADSGVLFLDEIHHLSKAVQAKLMKALQTDENNEMSIRKLGDTKETRVKCKLIFATNKTINELRKDLLPDFYDRIVQHVIEMPPLRETKEDRLEDWRAVWKNLRFGGDSSVPEEMELISWLNQLNLYGNYRDLQKIAMYYNAFGEFDQETLKMLSETSAFEYAKNEFRKYHSPPVQLASETYNFNISKTTKEMIADYKFALQEWAVEKFRGRDAAIKHFKSKGDTVSPKTFNDWKNQKSKPLND